MDQHANLFRSTFSDPLQAKGLLRNFLPAVLVAAIDWDSLELHDTEFLDQELRRSTVDLLFSVNIAGKPALIYLLLEHKSHQDPLTAWQMLRYFVRIQEHRLRQQPDATQLIPILPLVVHHGPQGWSCAQDVFELIDLGGLDPQVTAALQPFQPRFRFLLADLPEVTIDQLQQLAMAPLARLVLLSMQFLRGQDAESALGIMQGAIETVRQVRAAPGGRERLIPVWYYLFSVSDLDLQAVHDLVATELDDEIGDDMKTTADRIEEKAFEKFMATTAQKLEQRAYERFLATAVPQLEQRAYERFLATAAEQVRQDRAARLLRQIERRFGFLADSTRDRVQSASAEQLDRWLDAILDAPSLDALLSA